ncbi:TIGR00730 family Rossman fold protein [Thermodesulfobacteriota bacterium]
MKDNHSKDKSSKSRFYYDREFLSSHDARTLRLIAEYHGPIQRFKRNHVEDTIVFFGASRIKSREEALRQLEEAAFDCPPDRRRQLDLDLGMSDYYEAARELAFRLTKWSKTRKTKKKRFIVTSGGGPGIMEAANRGASEAKGLSIGLNITLPFEQSGNRWLTPDLSMEFHYFFMRKFWFIYLAKALVVFPGGFGTMDELFELLTLSQTKKMDKVIPVVLFGDEFWSNVINWDYLVDAGTISREDLDMFEIFDTVDDAYDYLTDRLSSSRQKGPNF